MPSAKRITIATIGAPHGVKGEVRLKSFASDPIALSSYGPLLADDGRTFEIERLRPAKGALIAKFRGIDDRDAAAALTGLSLFVARSALPTPEADEFYHADLIGLDAVDASGEKVGSVAAVLNHGAGDILEIARTSDAGGSGPSFLVPFTTASVPDIDLKAGRLTIVPPDEIEIETEEE